MAESKFGAYTVISQLASGGMAEISLARQNSVGGFSRNVIIKKIHSHLSRNQRFISMFLNEARLLARMSHPNIATVFDFGVEDEAYCLVMEYVDGVTLKETIQKSSGIAPVHAIRIASEMCAGLHYAHMLADDEGQSLHVVHRDVSPQNVLLSFDGAVKIIDFGIAKASIFSDRTRAGALKGKYSYMSPEQITGKSVDHRSDQHAVGIILWEMLTGLRLFYRGNIHVSLQAVLKEKPLPLGEARRELVPVGEHLDWVIAKTLAKKPDDRFEDCAQLQNVLDDLAFDLKLRSSASRLADYLRSLFPVTNREKSGKPDKSTSSLRSFAVPGAEKSSGEMSNIIIDVDVPESEENIPAQEPKGAPVSSSDEDENAFFDSAELLKTQELEGIFDALPSNSSTQTSITRDQFRRALERPSTDTGEPTGPIQNVTNLPLKHSKIIGRQKDLIALRNLLSEGHRLITIHGPAGVGKTRLALRCGQDHLEEFTKTGGGVWFCDLTEASSVEEVCFEVSRVLQVPLFSGDSKKDSVVQVSHALNARGRALFVLDNFEQLASLAKEIIDKWLELAPEALFLVTSRDGLGLAAEAVYELYPLSIEKTRAQDRSYQLQPSSDAVQLFLERARVAQRGFDLTQKNAPIIEEIVAQLDGLPLALELAAARMSGLTPERLLLRLRSRFDVLSQETLGESPRQTTLRGALDWSWSLLEKWEKVALAQLSVFAGGFDIDAAENVVDLSRIPDAPPILDVIQSLGNKSLIRTTKSTEFPNELRLGLYESIREYAREKLEQSGEQRSAFSRHGVYYLELCEPWAAGVGGREANRFLRLLARERDNLVKVLERKLATGLRKSVDIALALQAVLILDPILRARGPHKKHLEWIETVMKATRARVFDKGTREIIDKNLMIRGYLVRGEVRRVRKRSNESRYDFSRALELAREIDDLEHVAEALFGLGNIAQGQGRVEESIRLFEESLAVGRRIRDRAAQGATLAVLGSTKIWLSLLDEAQDLLEEALICLRESGAPRHEGFVLVGLGALHFERRENKEARVYVEEALEVLDKAWEPRYRGEALMYMGCIEWEDENTTAAHKYFNRALRLSRVVGDRLFEARYLALRSAVEACTDRFLESQQGFSAAEEAAAMAGSHIDVCFVDVLKGQLDLLASRRAAQQKDFTNQQEYIAKARERLTAAESKGEPDAAHPEGAPSMTDVSDEVRIAVRMLRRELERP